MYNIKSKKEIKRSFKHLGPLTCIAMLGIMFSLLTSCQKQNETSLPGQLLLRSDDKLAVLDSGEIQSKFDLQVHGAKWSQDGQHIAFKDSEGDISIFTLNGEQQTKLVDGGELYIRGFDWSADGQKIAFVASPQSDPGWGLYIVDVLNPFHPYKIWACEYDCAHPNWLSDEQYIILSERVPSPSRERLTQVKQVNIETGEFVVLFSIERTLTSLQSNRLETQIALTDQGHSRELVVLDMNGKNPKTIATNIGEVVWSPDGKWLAFNKIQGSQMFVGVYNLETEETKKIYSKSFSVNYVLDWRE